MPQCWRASLSVSPSSETRQLTGRPSSWASLTSGSSRRESYQPRGSPPLTLASPSRKSQSKKNLLNLMKKRPEIWEFYLSCLATKQYSSSAWILFSLYIVVLSSIKVPISEMLPNWVFEIGTDTWMRLPTRRSSMWIPSRPNLLIVVTQVSLGKRWVPVNCITMMKVSYFQKVAKNAALDRLTDTSRW